MHPEVSGKEKRTSEEIATYLVSLGLEVKKGVGGYGVIGILHAGRPGKRIAWRADIDAISSDAPDVVKFSSKNVGVRHICGHDVHTSPNAKFWDNKSIFSAELGVTNPNTMYKDYNALMSDFDIKNSGDTLKIRVLLNTIVLRLLIIDTLLSIIYIWPGL